ncbi:MAG TPA: shikimate kinase [Gemmatimonadaceae bacterium]
MTPTFRTSRPGSAADPSRPHIILVGLPGSGKSSVGRAVAAQLGRTFLDLDLEIERREGRSISEIFGENGEAYFRAKELSLTKELQQVGHMILAPGGGWITIPDVVGLLRPPGRLIYLRVQPETALQRLGTRRTLRPLLTRPDPEGELKRLYEQRRTAYETADHVVDTELYSLQRVIEKVMELASPSA